MKLLRCFALAAVTLLSSFMTKAADTLDAEGYPIMYVRGTMTNGWSAQDAYKLTRNGNTYSITLESLDGEFKVSGDDWQCNYGCIGDMMSVSGASTFEVTHDGSNIIANNLKNVTIKYDLVRNTDGGTENTVIYISANGESAPDQPVTPDKPEVPDELGLSGTLPVLYINVYNADGVTYNNEVIDRNLSHKEYFQGEYWLDLNGCEWMAAEGAASIGSSEAPLPLEIKARGNYTRTAFSKKPFKLKLGEKQKMLGLTKSKHFAILAHADDHYGYMRNFTGFYLGRQIGLPWTPNQQPVEVVINGDYRGLYFLTESIRIEKDRVNIQELDDEVSDAALISGGYLVELDNYDEDNQIRLDEKSCADGYYLDKLRVTWDTPELYSDLQKRFVTEQFTAMNDYIGENSDELWKYMDLDDAARYYLVEEIVSHTESYHGSTYLFRDRGENQKWHFSPLWDFGNAFNGSTSKFLYDCSPYGNTWIPSMRCNETFNNKVKETWMWFMNNGYKGVFVELANYVNHLKVAANADYERWKDVPRPDYSGTTQDVADNRDIEEDLQRVMSHLNEKVSWLSGKFGDYTANPDAPEPARDTTPAAPLPDYAKDLSGVEDVELEVSDAEPVYYNLQGIIVDTPQQGNFYIVRKGDKVTKQIFR